MQVKVVVPSRGRPLKAKALLDLIPDAILCVGQEEAEEYVKAVGFVKPMKIHPQEVVGIGAIRKWVIDNMFGDCETLMMLDDDVTGLWAMVGELGHRIADPGHIRQIIENAAECADGAGTPVFGFNQAWDVRKFDPCDPFILNSWVGTAIGFVKRHMDGLEYDRELLTQADIDFCLKVLLKKRLVWCDRRFSFMCQRFNNSGGSAGVRTEEIYRAQIERVEQRWGAHVKSEKKKGTIRLALSVPRRQTLDI